jgi:hypothetical protein
VFALDKPQQFTIYIFENKARDCLACSTLRVRLLALANIRLGCLGLPETTTLAYFSSAIMKKKEKMFCNNDTTNLFYFANGPLEVKQDCLSQASFCNLV